MRACCLVLLAAGCQQVFGLDEPLAIDASMTCVDRWIAGPTFGTPRPVIATTAGETSPFVTANGLALYFVRSGDIYVARRTAVDQPFGTASVASALSSTEAEGKVTLSPDEGIAIFASARPGTGGFDLWHASLNMIDRNGLLPLESGADEIDPHLSSDLRRLYFARTTAGVSHILFASRSDPNAVFGVPHTIDELMSAEGEWSPSVSGDERLIVFPSVRTNEIELWYATRTSTSQPFGAPRRVPRFNLGNPRAVHVTTDGCQLYVAFERPVPQVLDIYSADLN